MKRIIIAITLLLSMALLVSCTVKQSEEIDKAFQPYQKITFIEAMEEGSYNPGWLHQMKDQLITEYGVSEMTADRLMRDSTVQRCSLEYAGIQEYEGKSYPYAFNAELIIWQIESYYAIFEISNKALVSMDDRVAIVEEGPKESWVEDFPLLKALPIDQSIALTMGSRISFAEEGEDEVGPFTPVATFYISCPRF